MAKEKRCIVCTHPMRRHVVDRDNPDLDRDNPNFRCTWGLTTQDRNARGESRCDCRDGKEHDVAV